MRGAKPGNYLKCPLKCVSGSFVDCGFSTNFQEQAFSYPYWQRLIPCFGFTKLGNISEIFHTQIFVVFLGGLQKRQKSGQKGNGNKIIPEKKVAYVLTFVKRFMSYYFLFRLARRTGVIIVFFRWVKASARRAWSAGHRVTELLYYFWNDQTSLLIFCIFQTLITPDIILCTCILGYGTILVCRFCRLTNNDKNVNSDQSSLAKRFLLLKKCSLRIN